MKKIVSLALVLALCLSFLPVTAFAEENEAIHQPTYSGGSGTKTDPWLISKVDDLQKLQETVNSGVAAGFDADCEGDSSAVPGNYHGYYFKQTADLDLSSIENWEPIGYSGSCYFAGNYDADNHIISNAKSTGKNDDEGYATAGVFGWVLLGSVSNLHVRNSNFSATGHDEYSYVGGIAAVVYGSTIKNCSVIDSTIESKRNSDNNCAGSVTGYSTGGTFEKCAAENNQIKTMAYGGGFVGEVDDSYGVGESTFTNCYVTKGNVTAFSDNSSNFSFAGGFIGELTEDIVTLKNCYVYDITISCAESQATLKKLVFL